MKSLVISDLEVKYFGYPASIQDFSATFQEGINVIFGGEKSGKTTLLKAIGGIIPSSGSVLFEGKSLLDEPEKTRDVQMLFDDYAFFNRRSARYNLMYPLRLRKFPKSYIVSKVNEAAKLFGLEVMLDAPVYRLTTWHKVALQCARAYIRKPKILLIDNIFSRFDDLTRKEACYTFLPMLNNGIVIYATDSISEATSSASPITVLSAGYKSDFGYATEIAKRSGIVSTFKTFHRFSSVLACHIEASQIEIQGQAFDFNTSCLMTDEYIGADSLVGLTPNSAKIGDRGIAGIVVANYSDGSSNVAAVKTDTEIVYASGVAPIGENVKVEIDLEKAILFDSYNERRIN